jgi:2-polyprenyl-3-methyl-5-hydroxy-6-metoxy-1,4-benzoquinol methylase
MTSPFTIVGLLRKRSTLPPLAVSMAGAKLGDRVLVMGCGDPALVAALASKTGLTGRTLAVDESAEQCRKAEVVALREGALIETATAQLTAVPADDDSFDLVVLRDVLPHLDDNSRLTVVTEARRVVRPGGRCLVVDGWPRRGLAAWFGGAARTDGGAAATAAFSAMGFAAVRTLAERDGQVFVEAVRQNR